MYTLKEWLHILNRLEQAVLEIQTGMHELQQIVKELKAKAQEEMERS